MHNPNDKYPTRPGLEPRTSEFRATAGSNQLLPFDYTEQREEHLSPWKCAHVSHTSQGVHWPRQLQMVLRNLSVF